VWTPPGVPAFLEEQRHEELSRGSGRQGRPCHRLVHRHRRRRRQGFAACGARVAVHCNRSRADAEKVVAAIKKEGGTAVLLQGDLSKSAEARRVVEETVAAFGRIDVLVNNVGGLVRRTMAVDNEDDVVDAIIDLNIRSVVAATRAAIPHFEKQGGGIIINTGSVAARHGGGPGASVYAATKGFVHTVTKSLAKELVGSKIRVNTVSPAPSGRPSTRRLRNRLSSSGRR